MDKRQAVLVKYNPDIFSGSIEEHINVLKREGFCWFGKIGKRPSLDKMKLVLGSEDATLILYSKGAVYKCRLADYTCDLPGQGVPEYYKELSEYGSEWCYFKLMKIEPIAVDSLKDYWVTSSKKNLLDTVGRMMASFVFVEFDPGRKSSAKNSNGQCKYLQNDVCGNKRCVNYKYICERPSYCASRK